MTKYYSISEIMFNVGVHMLSLAGEHLLVQTCFMFIIIIIVIISYCSVVICTGKCQRHPEGE